MLEFEYIRQCLKKGQHINLNLMDREEVLRELDPYDVTLRSISYDFQYKSSEETQRREYHHDAIKFGKKSWDQMDCVSMWDLNRPLRVQVIGVDGLEPNNQLGE